MMQPNALPIELRHRDQWVAWRTAYRDGTPTKTPLDPATGTFASTADPATWTSFDRALAYTRRQSVDGLGFVFTGEDPYVGVDLDDCRDPDTGTLSTEAIDILMRLYSYTEVSPSEKGLHVIVEGRLPDGPRRRGTVELYDERRFFTMTGARLTGLPDRVRSCPAAVRAVHQRYLGARETPETASASERASGVTAGATAVTLDDAELLEKAMTAANGSKFTALWNGQTTGYPSQSEADMALCCLLAFWTGGDRNQVDRLFRASGLLRSKWDEIHFADGATYGERTIERALSQTTDHYAAAVTERYPARRNCRDQRR